MGRRCQEGWPGTMYAPSRAAPSCSDISVLGCVGCLYSPVQHLGSINSLLFSLRKQTTGMELSSVNVPTTVNVPRSYRQPIVCRHDKKSVTLAETFLALAFENDRKISVSEPNQVAIVIVRKLNRRRNCRLSNRGEKSVRQCRNVGLYHRSR